METQKFNLTVLVKACYNEFCKAPVAMLLAVVALANPFAKGGLLNPYQPRVISNYQVLSQSQNDEYVLKFSWQNISPVPAEVTAEVLALDADGNTIPALNGESEPSIFELEVEHPRVMVGEFSEVPEYLVACVNARSLASEWATFSKTTVYKRYKQPYPVYGLASTGKARLFSKLLAC